MNEHEKLREQMWELVYGLTSADETAALHARIKSDRAAARMYAEVRLEADLIAEAAKVEDATIALPQPGGQKERAAAGRAKELSNAPAASSAGAGWSLHWLGAIGASALAVLMAVGIFWREKQPPREETYLVSVDVYADQQPVAGLDAEFDIWAKDANEGKPASVALDAQIAKSDGTPLYQQSLKTDEFGRGRLHVPADYIDPGNKLQMFLEHAPPEQQVAQQTDGVAPPPAAADHQIRQLQRVEATLERAGQPLVEATLGVIEDPLKARFRFDQDWYEPGETIEFRAHVTSAFTQRPPDVQSLDLRLVGPDGSEISPEETQPHPQNGVVTGKFRLPAEAQRGHYAVTIQNSTRGEPQARAIVQVGRQLAQLDAGTRYARDVSELAAADVKQQDESRLVRGRPINPEPAAGTLPREEEGRRQKSDQPGGGAAKDPATKETPARESGRPVGGAAERAPPSRAVQPPTPPPAGSVPAANPPAPAGKDDVDGTPPSPALAEADFANRRNDANSRALDELRQVADSKKLSEAATTLSVVPPPLLAGKPLLVEARQSGVVISKLKVPAEHRELGERLGEETEVERLGHPLSIALPPQVSGPVDVYYFDISGTQPKRVRAERFDIPARDEFEVALAQAATKYAPGETVRFKVQVRDQGQAASNVSLGFKVAPLLAMTADDAPAVQRGGESESFQKRNLEAADAPVADAKEGEEASQDRRGMAQLEGGGRAKGAQDAPARSAAKTTPAPDAAGALGPVALGGAAASEAQKGAAMELREPSKEALQEPFGFGRAGDQLTVLEEDQIRAEQPATPTLLASNADAVRRALDEEQAAETAREARFARWRHWLGKGLLLGGVLLLVVLGVGVYLQRPSQARAWVPSLAIAAASFIVGMVWLIQSPRREGTFIAKRESTIADREMPEPRSGMQGVATGTAAPEDVTAFDAAAPSASESAAQFGGIEGADYERAAAGGFGGGGRNMPSPALSPADPVTPEAATERAESLSDLQLRKMSGPAASDAAVKSELEAAPRDGADPGKKLAAGESPKGETVNEAIQLKDNLQRDKASPPQPKSARGPSSRTGAAHPAERGIAKDADTSGDKVAEKDEKGDLRAQTRQKTEVPLAEPQNRTLAAPGADRFRLFRMLGDGESRSAGSVWVPLLVADENGEAVIEFTMPQEPGEYKLILDVLGPGRSTQVEKIIRCEAPQPAVPAAEAKP